MRFRGLDLNLLVVLEALFRDKNVTHAARRLGISQPGMSAALKRLRQHYGDELVELEGRKATLTPFAKDLEAPLKKVLGQIRALMKMSEKGH